VVIKTKGMKICYEMWTASADCERVNTCLHTALSRSYIR